MELWNISFVFSQTYEMEKSFPFIGVIYPLLQSYLHDGMIHWWLGRKIKAVVWHDPFPFTKAFVLRLLRRSKFIYEENRIWLNNRSSWPINTNGKAEIERKHDLTQNKLLNMDSIRFFKNFFWCTPSGKHIS